VQFKQAGFFYGFVSLTPMTSTKVAQCFAHQRPALERANRKTQLGLLGQRKPRVTREIDELLGSLFHEEDHHGLMWIKAALVVVSRALSTSHMGSITMPLPLAQAAAA
jgi:hypothetical protein